MDRVADFDRNPLIYFSCCTRFNYNGYLQRNVNEINTILCSDGGSFSERLYIWSIKMNTDGQKGISCSSVGSCIPRSRFCRLYRE